MSTAAHRVFTKSSTNGKVSVYLGKQDYIDYCSHIDPIDGVVTIDPNSLQGGKVFAHVRAAFHYGREDLDVMGLSCSKDLYRSTIQVFPRTVEKPLTPLQEQLLAQLGPNAHPFLFELPPHLADSVKLQGGRIFSKLCGVDYEVKVYVAEIQDEKPLSGHWVRLAIRKLTIAPEEVAPQPRMEKVTDFFMSPGAIRVDASLDKEKYFHGEDVEVNIQIDNKSSKVIKKIKLAVVQETSMVLHDDSVSCIGLCETVFTDGFPIQPNQTGVKKQYHLKPNLDNCRNKTGLAVDGNACHVDTCIASSTIVTRHSDKEKIGIMVAYHVVITLVMSFGARDLKLDLPFTLTRPTPDTPCTLIGGDIIFEDFARERLKRIEGCNDED